MYCEKCGSEINANNKFCAKCGAAVTHACTNDIQDVNQNSNKKRKSKKGIIITLCIISVGVLLAVLLNLGLPKKEKETTGISDEYVQQEQGVTNNSFDNIPDTPIEDNGYRINRVYEFSDNYAWVDCVDADDNRGWICIDKEGNGIFEINDASATPASFNGGLSFYKNSNNNYTFVNTKGEKIFSSENLFDDIISYGEGFFAVYKYIKDFENVGYDVLILNSAGKTVYRFAELFESIPKVNYCGEGVFSYKTWGSAAGSAEYLFINAADGNAFNVSGIASDSNMDDIFNEGVGFVKSGTNRMGDLPTLIYKNGTAKELDIIDYNFYKYGKISDGGFVLTSYDNDGVNAVYFYNFSTEKSMRLGTFAERVDLNRANQLYFDDGYMLLPLLGADGKRYFTILDKNGSSLFDPIECVDVRSIGKDRIQVVYNDKVVFTNRKGETVFESSENSGWLNYNCGYAVVYDNCNYIDVDGNVLFEDGVIELKGDSEDESVNNEKINYYSNASEWSKPYAFSDLSEIVYCEYGNFVDVPGEKLGIISAFEVDCDEDGNNELLTVSLVEAGNNKLYICPKLFTNKNNLIQLEGVSFSDSIKKSECPVIEFGNNESEYGSFFSVLAFVDKGKLCIYYDVGVDYEYGRPEHFSNFYVYNITNNGIELFKHYYFYEEEKVANIRSHSLGEAVSEDKVTYEMSYDINIDDWTNLHERELEEWKSIKHKKIDEMLEELSAIGLEKYLTKEDSWITNSYAYDENCSYFEGNGGTAKHISAIYGHIENDQYKIYEIVDYTDVRSKIIT